MITFWSGELHDNHAIAAGTLRSISEFCGLAILQLHIDFNTTSQNERLRPTVSWPVCLCVRHPSGTRDQIFSFLLQLFLDSFGLVHVVRPLWREVGYAVFSFWSSPVQCFSGLSPAGLMIIFYCLSFWDSPNLEGQVLVFSPRNRVSELYPPGIGFSTVEELL
jgi:hypothetical protein